jgi:hypothetical protein
MRSTIRSNEPRAIHELPEKEHAHRGMI